MSNPQRQKGTTWEVELRDDHLRPLFYPDLPVDMDDHPLQRLDDAGRHKRAEDGDYVGVPYTIEAKSTQRPMFQQWARKLEKKVGKAWVLVWHGDRRAKTGSGPYVVMPLEFWLKTEEIVQRTLEQDEMLAIGYRQTLKELQEFYS